MRSSADLLSFAQANPLGLAYLASNGRFAVPQHIHLIADRLYQLARGDIKRLMIFCPPRHGKSLLCSQYFTAWYIGAFRGRVILTSYESSFAATWGRLSRNALTEWGPVIWPRQVKVAQDSSAADHWELEGAQGQHGVMYTAGVGSAITGKGASLLVIDDPVKNSEEAASPVMRNKAWEWYTSTAYTRLEPDGRILVIQTRWHDDDLSGRILANASEDTEPWHVLSLPAIAEREETYEIAGGAPFHRDEGEPLWPQRFNAERLATIRADVGGKVWTALYQQRPAPEDGMVWHREWFGRYRELPTLVRKIQTVDSAFKTGVANDYSVIATWGRTATDYYLIDVWRGRVEFTDLKHALRDAYAKHQPGGVYVEDKASGQSVLQELARETSIPVIPWRNNDPKLVRAQTVSPLAEARKVWIPESAPWLADWLDEHVAFPNAAHDDMVDTTSMALAELRGGTWGIMDW